jgi:hypothetical protein
MTDADILTVYDLLFPIGQEYVDRIERAGEYHIEAKIRGRYTESVMREIGEARLAGSPYRLTQVYTDRDWALIRVESPIASSSSLLAEGAGPGNSAPEADLLDCQRVGSCEAEDARDTSDFCRNGW